METIEEPPLQNVAAEAVKVNVTVNDANTDTERTVQMEVCHKSNGVADLKEAEHVMDSEAVEHQPMDGQVLYEGDSSNIIVEEEITEVNIVSKQELLLENALQEITATTAEIVTEVIPTETVNQDDLELKTDNDEHIQAEEVEIDGIVETVSDNVRFETEILIETNVDDQSSKYKIIYSDTEEPDSNNILNELGQNIELSDVLRSSDVTEHVENNNCEVRQEVFNKEELLDILEGNDVEESRKVISETFASDCKKLETQLALQQLSRLQYTKKSRNTPKKTDKRYSKKSESPKEDIIKRKSRNQKEDKAQISSDSATEHKEETVVQGSETAKEESIKKKTKKQKEDNEQGGGDSAADPKDESIVKVSETAKEESIKKKSRKPKEDNAQSGNDSAVDPKDESIVKVIEIAKEESAKKKSKKQREEREAQCSSDSAAQPKEVSIVNALVKDWDDDEPIEEVDPNKVIPEGDNLPGESEELVKICEAPVNESNVSTADTSIANGSNLNKSDSETQPQSQRRLGRVIKKKVIFDPDNPDTFTKSKMTVKKEIQSDKDQKEQPAPKKNKTDPTCLRSKSKSPIQSKLQWKKPQPKNLKQNKRLTEIDRLLMDEGAVNMICQLTPEAPKGHKNMKSKAEFIKKIQSSSTPEGKEMKFRERKKEFRSEECDAKRIGSGKERLSLSSSVKSPCVSEDFEAHSADDSIIYRRHSSSSYSSPCMSPRRMSDVESINQSAQAISQAKVEALTQVGSTSGSDVFMSENVETIATGVINKSDFLSIKEKLNSKLSQALNKRKRDSIRIEKPSKIKKISKFIGKPVAVDADYKYVKVSIDQKLAEICIQYAGSAYSVEVINELKTVLEAVDSNNDVSVTMLSAESGTLSSGLNLIPILDQEKGASYAREIAESARSLLCTLEGHSKLVCTTVEDRCHGLGLSMVALSDVTVASERATFELSAEKGAPLQPGVAVLSECGLPQSLLNEIVVFERPISSSEALQCGLVSRTIWPERFLEQVRAIAKHIAAQPTENILLKKQLLRLKRGGSESFLAAMDKERDLFVKYWTSNEGRELLRASLEPAKE